MKMKMWTVCVVLAVLVLGLCMGPAALAQQSLGGVTFGTFSGIPTTVALSSTTNAVSGAVLLRQNRGIALIATLTDASNTGGNVTISYNVSHDGTNYCSTKPIRWVIDTTLTNSSGVVIAYTNVPPTWLNNVRYIKTASIQNASTNGLTAVSLGYSYANSSGQ